MAKVAFFRLTNVILLISISVFPATHGNPSGVVSNDTVRSSGIAEVRVEGDSSIQPVIVVPQAKNSILSLKTGRNALKVVGVLLNLIFAEEAVKNKAWKDRIEIAGFLGTSVALVDSIYSSYRSHSQADMHSAMRAALVLAKLLGVYTYLCEFKTYHTSYGDIIVGLPFLGFLGHGLYNDYQIYIAARKKTNGVDESSAAKLTVVSDPETAQINHATNDQKRLS